MQGDSTDDARAAGHADATARHVQRLEFGLRGVGDLDHLTRTTLEHFVTLPGVVRAGLALTEGAGRRLRFASTDGLAEGDLRWCHIDAYDDVPLIEVARSGQLVYGSVDGFGSRFAEFLAHQRELGTRALAALPLPAGAAALGGIILYFDQDQAFPEGQRRALETAARRIAEAVARVSAAGHSPDHHLGETADGVHRATLELDADPRAAGAARRFLRQRLEEWGIDDDVADSAQLCASELVNNVIMHARTTSRLTLSMEERQLTVMLRDLGGAAVGGEVHKHHPVTDGDEFRVFGRGLTLVDALSDDWGSHRDDIGTTAWFVFRLDPSQDDSAQQTG